MVGFDGFRKTYITLIYVSVFFIHYILFLNQGLQHTGPLGAFASETYSHMMFSKPYLHEDWMELLKSNFEPLLHVLTAIVARFFQFISSNEEVMNLANAAAFILAAAKTAQFLIIKKIIDEMTALSEARSLFLTIVINVSTVLYLPFITLSIYLPMITPNMLIDPTNILLEPFAILFFYLYLRNYIKQKPVSYAYSVGLCFLLIVATLVKPAFTNIIMLFMGLYYIFNIKRFASLSFLHDLLIYLPSCAILIWQVLLITKSPAGGYLEFAPYKVIGYYTTHPFISLFQAIEFPLLITAVCLCIKSDLAGGSKYLQFSWLFCMLAYLIYALFAFAGPAWPAANLAWSYQIGLSLLYLFSMIEYSRVLSSQKTGGFLTNLCAINFSLIFLSGIHQFVKIFFGGFYF